jgi:exonuclease III
MRGEFQLKKGPKISMIRKLVTPHTDFLILTEIRADQRAIMNTKIKYGIRPSHFSTSQHPRGGVLICANQNHKKMAGSERQSTTPGHIAAAVYEVKKSRTVVLGIYGISENNDRLSANTIREASSILTDLKILYNTQHVIVAGDFNAVLEPEDSSSREIRKRATSAALHLLIERHSLTDLARKSNKIEHTWFKKGIISQSSRIDLILTSIPIINLKTSNTHTFFDHTFLTATLSQAKSPHVTPMKDYIIGSDEFLIRAIDLIEQHIATTSKPKRNTPREEEQNFQDDDEAQQKQSPLDENRDFFNSETGQTPLHTFNSLIKKLQMCHNEIARKNKNKINNKIRDISISILQLKRQIKAARNPIEKREINNRLEEVQRSLAMETESREKAAQMRISNFYKTGTGKMSPETFYCIKERHPNREIHSLTVDGRNITDPEEIVHTMQNWYENTAQHMTPQTTTLTDFLDQHDILLPQLTDEQKDILAEEFSTDEISEAIKEAQENSAPGPSGQNISFYKLLFMLTPTLMTDAINQMVFVPQLIEDKQFAWVRNRKVCYIPKKPNPTTPSDYRPLSMLEVLYKIPSRILARRLNRVLPTIIGTHQHGFMTQKGIQEPSILATHLIQEANYNNKSLQLVSFDIEKAFDRVSHCSIIQALRAFGVPEITIMAIQFFSLIGFAYVEVNGKKGILITVRTGSGQGDPISSILFLLATEPLNRALAQNYRHLMYTTRGNLTVGPILFADDNLNPLSMRSANDIQPIIDLYNQYTTVSGLNINIRKTTALCINTPPQIIQGLNQMGIETPEVCKHLGILLGKTIEETIEATMRNTEPKRIKRRILATAPPTDLLHRALLINTALIPIYNHIFMALPTQAEHIKALHQEIIDFLWTRQQEGETIQKRRLVAKDRISASFEKGGLQVPHPADTADGLHLNLLQKIYNKIRLPDRYPNSLLPNILHETLQDAGCPSFQHHLENLGPEKWDLTASRIKNRNLLFSQAFQAMAKLLRINEKDRKTWHAAAINGHSKFNKLLPLSQNEAGTLRAHNLITISQLYETNEHGTLQNNPNTNVNRLLAHEPGLIEKLNLLRQAINRLHLPLQDKRHTELVSAGLLLRGETNMSRGYRKTLRNIKDSTIKIAPAYHTRRQDGVYYPTIETFNKAYNIIQLSSLPSKTKETSFQIINRTIWTNNKAFKSGSRENPECEYCGQIETMEHLIHDCENYSTPLWIELGECLTRTLRTTTGKDIAEIRLTPLEIIFNKIHPSIQVHIKEKPLQQILLHLLQEVKRDIIFRRMNTSTHQERVNPNRIRAHLLSTVSKIISLLQYQETRNHLDSINLLVHLQTVISDRVY